MHRALVARRLTALLAATLIGILAISPTLAADTLTPLVVNSVLPAGGTTDVAKSLQLDGLPARADIIIAIDTTGSMGVPIAQAQADAVNICNTVKAAIPGARFAAVDFEDYAAMTGGTPADTPYTLLTPGFISDCLVFSAAIATMTADGGGDGPEAYNRAFFEAVNEPAYGLPVLAGGRDAQATQFLVVLGDAAPHSATSFSSCPAAPPSDFGRNGAPGGGDDLDTGPTIAALAAANIHLLMIRYPSANSSVTLSCYQALAAAAGGTAVDNSAAPSIGTFIINNAQATPYTVALQTSLGCQIGFSFSPAFPTGSLTGPQTIPFTETITAPTVPGNYTCTITAVTTPGGTTSAVETVNLTVTAGAPATLDLQPPTANNVVDSQHCVTAAVRDAFGNLVPNTQVTFTVTGSVTTGGTATTNAGGVATFCYTGPALPGSDLITASAGGTATDTATKTWRLPANDTACKVNNGGRITAANGDKATFGGNAKGAGPRGQEEYQDHGATTDINVHSINVLSVTCNTAGTQASIFGKATINGAGSWDYRIDVKDLAEPGTADTYRIRMSNGYDSGEKVLSGGNVQIH